MCVLLSFWMLTVFGSAAPLLPMGRPAVVDFAFLGPELVAVATGEGMELWQANGEALQFWPRLGIRALATGARGERLVLALESGVEVWSMPKGAPVLTLRFPSLRPPDAVAMSPGEMRVAAHDGFYLGVWETNTGYLLLWRSADMLNANYIAGLAFLGEEELLISTDKALFLWPLAAPSPRKVADLGRPLLRPVGDALRRWAVIPSARELRLVEVDTGRTLRLLWDFLEAVGFTSEGELVVWSWEDGALGFHIVPAEGLGRFCILRKEVGWSPLRVGLSPEGKHVAVLEISSFSARLRVQKLSPCDGVAVLGPWATELVDCALAADGRYLVAARLGGLEVWDVESRKLHATLDATTLPVQEWLLAVYPVFRRVLPHPQRAVVAAAFSFVPKVVVWNWENGDLVDLNLVRPYPGPAPTGPALSLTFTPGGNALVFVHQRGGISCWEWASRSTRWGDPQEDERSLPLVSADGRFVLTVGPSSLRVRDAATGRVLDEQNQRLFVRNAFALEERDFLLETTAGWYRLRLSPEGRALPPQPLPQIPVGKGSMAPDGRTLAVLVPPADPSTAKSVLWLWDMRENRALRRLEFPSFLPCSDRAGGVLLSPGGTQAILWCPKAAFWLLSLLKE